MRAALCGIGPFLLVFMVAGPSPAADPKDEIASLSKAYDAALKARDAKALDKLFDDDGQFVVQPDGRLMGKKDYIAWLTRAQVTYETADSTIGSIRVYGDAAIEAGTWTSIGTEDGKPKTARERYTSVWVKKAGSWVLTSEQVTPITDVKK